MRVVVWLIVLMFVCACDDDGHLRGEVTGSRDGHTYLVIDDDNGGGCGDLIVDGAVWELGVRVQVEPGVHTIECDEFARYRPGDGIEFDIPAGVVFHFNYWGP